MNKAFQLNALAVLVISLSYTLTHADERASDLTFSPIVVAISTPHTAAIHQVIRDPKQATQPIPASDGAAYLKTVMGFNGIQSGGTNSDITFRGMFGSRIKVRVDGAENLGACPNRMDAPTSYIAPESFDRIEITKGPQSVIYPMGSAATVNFERKAPQLTQEKGYIGEVSSIFGSFGRMDQNVQASIGGQQYYARLNANRSVADSYRDGHNHIVPSAWSKWSSDLALGWTPSDATVIELKGGKSDGEALYGGREMDGSQFKRESLGLKLKHQLKGNTFKQLQAQIDYSDNDHVMDNFSLRPFKPSGMMSMPMAMNVARQTINSRIQADYQLGKAQLVSGIDGQISKHSGRMGMKNSYLTKPYVQDARFENYGAFTELTYPLFNQLKGVVGARVDQSQIEDLRAASANSGFNLQRQHTSLGGFMRIEGNQQASRWSIGIGHVERMPDYWELFTPVHGNSGSTNTFNGVNPEKTTQLDVNYRYRQGPLSANASVYYGQIKDFILINYHHHASTPMAGMSDDMHHITPSAKNINATIAGAEVGLGYALTDSIKADVGLAYAWGKNDDNGTPLPQIAPLEGRLNLTYQRDQYSIGALVRGVARQNRVALHQGNIVGYDLGPTAGFSTLSINGAYRFTNGLEWSMGVDNLLNRAYSEHLNKAGSANFGFADDEQLNNPGRNYWTRVSLKF